jgi:SAM-dependent methyltransferase
MPDTYDLLPYTEHAYAESHPDNLEVVARLSGFSPALQRSAVAPRVLELGCGRGGNLLPMAASWPEAAFVGVDRSDVQIRDARRIAEAAALGNVTFLAADFAGVELPAGAFDFVLCHGVYSWVPVASRPALLAGVRAALAGAGVAYVSFNTLPGWYRRLAARDWMRFAARTSFPGGPRDALAWLHRRVSPEHAAYRADLAEVHARLLATDAAYLTHEYLAEEHHPVHASAFVAEAEEAGLAYLGDALPRESAPELLADEVQAHVRGLDLPRGLDLADFTRDTAFRRALLVRSDTAHAASFRPPGRLDPRAIEGLRLASRLRPSAVACGADLQSFEGADATVQASGIARRALVALAEAAPRSLPCTELARRVGTTAQAMAAAMYDVWIATPGVDLHAREPGFVTTVSRLPRASAVARWHATEGGPVTNVWHQEVELVEPVVRRVLASLDGSASADRIARAVRDPHPERVSEVEAEAVVKASLEVLAKAALLVA